MARGFEVSEELKRTLQQNKAMHKYYTMLADKLNESGLDMKKVLKPGIDIPWSPTSVKEFLWRPIQDAMLDKESTRALTTDEVDKIYRVLDRHLGEKLGIHVEFPNRSGE
jgi:hypothetical protein